MPKERCPQLCGNKTSRFAFSHHATQIPSRLNFHQEGSDANGRNEERLSKEVSPALRASGGFSDRKGKGTSRALGVSSGDARSDRCRVRDLLELGAVLCQGTRLASGAGNPGAPPSPGRC